MPIHFIKCFTNSNSLMAQKAINWWKSMAAAVCYWSGQHTVANNKDDLLQSIQSAHFSLRCAVQSQHCEWRPLSWQLSPYQVQHSTWHHSSADDLWSLAVVDDTAQLATRLHHNCSWSYYFIMNIIIIIIIILLSCCLPTIRINRCVT